MNIVIDGRIRRSSTGRYVDRLLEHLQAIDKENHYIILLEPDDDWHPHAKNFEAVDCPYPQFSFSPIDQFRFARQLYRLKPDLVHFTMTQQPLFYFGNIVTTTHDLTMLHFVRPGATTLPIFWVKKLLYRFLFWWSHRKSGRIIVPTNYVADDLSELQPFTTTKIRVTYEASEPPIALKAVVPALIKDNHRPPVTSQQFILYVGSAFPHKNLEGLVKAFKKLKGTHPKLHLVMAGKKEHHYEQLEKFVQKSSVKNSVILPGFVTDAELKWLYENAAVYVFPSLSEGFGLPGLEAMVHGCPVVSSNATCLPEVYDDAAAYFDPHDINNMASKIAEVINDDDLRETLMKCGYIQAGKYSWRKMAEETLAIYQETLKKPLAPSAAKDRD